MRGCRVVVAVFGSVVAACLLSPSALAASYDATVIADAPSGYWRLGEGSGPTAFDSSGNGFHGTYQGPSLGQVGAIPRARTPPRGS